MTLPRRSADIARRSADIARLRPRKLTVSCPDCDVTWRGTLRDACWHCGGHRTTEAPPAQVKVVS